jgi:hypothetical protein
MKCFCVVIFSISLTTKNGGVLNLSLSLKEIVKSLHKSIVFWRTLKTQAGNMWMVFFFCVKCWIRGSVCHSSGSLPVSWHPRLLWEHSVAPRSSGIVPVSGPSQLTGRPSRRIQGSLASFFLRWGISGSGRPRACITRSLHYSKSSHLTQGYNSSRMNEWTWITIPWL